MQTRTLDFPSGISPWAWLPRADREVLPCFPFQGEGAFAFFVVIALLRFHGTPRGRMLSGRPCSPGWMAAAAAERRDEERGRGCPGCRRLCCVASSSGERPHLSPSAAAAPLGAPRGGTCRRPLGTPCSAHYVGGTCPRPAAPPAHLGGSQKGGARCCPSLEDPNSLHLHHYADDV